MSFILKSNKSEFKETRTVKSEKRLDEVAWVFPFALEDWEKLNLSKFDTILVKSTEKAVVFENEQIVEDIANGIYSIKRDNGVKNLKIVFLEGSNFDIKWGMSQQQGVLTSDNIKIGASGMISLSISSPGVFCLNILKEAISLDYSDIKLKINAIIRESMRAIVSQYDIIEIQKISKEELTMMMESELIADLTNFGISSEGFSLSGIGIPPEFRK